MEPSEDLEIGDAMRVPAGVVLSLEHRTAAGRVAALALLPNGGPPARVLDLAPVFGDAPPPRLALRSAGRDGRRELPATLLAAAYLAPSAQSSPPGVPRELGVWSVDASARGAWAGDAAGAPLFRVAQHRDDSLAYDMAYAAAGGLLVWDESSPGPPYHGVIRSARFEAAGQGQAPATREVSPVDSDAEMPRVVAIAEAPAGRATLGAAPAGGPPGAGAPGRGAFFVVWIARRPEGAEVPEAKDAGATPAPGPPTRQADRSGGPIVEAVGEPRTYAWLEMGVVDERGVPAGPVRRLTSSSGHISSFDAMQLPSPSRYPLLVVARDDGEAVDGTGGALLRIRAGEEGAEVPVELPSDGLGRGAPELVERAGSSAWLAWVGGDEGLRLLPLDNEGAPLGPPSVEAEIGAARPLLILPAQTDRPDSASDEMLVALAGPGSREANAVVACRR
jgi:hypothetical protein